MAARRPRRMVFDNYAIRAEIRGRFSNPGLDDDIARLAACLVQIVGISIPDDHFYDLFMNERSVQMISMLPDGSFKRYMIYKLCYDTFRMITTMPDVDIEQVPIYCDNMRRYFYGNVEWTPVSLDPAPGQPDIQTECLRLITYLRVSMHYMVTGVQLDVVTPENQQRNLNFAFGLRFHFNNETTSRVIEQSVRDQRAQQDRDEPSTVAGEGSERDLSENDFLENDFGDEHGHEVQNLVLTQVRDLENEAREISQAVSDISWKTALDEFESQQEEEP